MHNTRGTEYSGMDPTELRIVKAQPKLKKSK